MLIKCLPWIAHHYLLPADETFSCSVFWCRYLQAYDKNLTFLTVKVCFPRKTQQLPTMFAEQELHSCFMFSLLGHFPWWYLLSCFCREQDIWCLSTNRGSRWTSTVVGYMVCQCSNEYRNCIELWLLRVEPIHWLRESWFTFIAAIIPNDPKSNMHR